MERGRGVWWPVIVLLVLSAGAAAAATYLNWLPCRGTMLSGSILHGYAYGPDFSDACLKQMDQGFSLVFPSTAADRAPWVSELSIVASGAAALTWLPLILCCSWSAATRMVAGAAAAAALSFPVLATVALHDPGVDPPFSLSWWLAADVLSLAAMITIWVREGAFRGRPFTCLVAVLIGTTAFGGFHEIFEYTFMITMSDANWDTPPGTGYLAAGAVALAGALVLWLNLRRTRGVVAGARARVGSREHARA